MTKVIQDITLLKKLQTILDGVETEYFYSHNVATGNYYLHNGGGNIGNTIDLKTLTLEEAIELLPYKINEDCLLCITKYRNVIGVRYMNKGTEEIAGKELLEAIEKMLEYLLDNKLLGKN